MASTIVAVVGLLHCVADPPVLPEAIVITNEAAPPVTPDTGTTPALDAGCPAGQMACDGVCTNLLNDPAHCGVCTIACKAGEVCSSGACGLTCQAGLTLCTPTEYGPAAGTINDAGFPEAGFEGGVTGAGDGSVPDGGPNAKLARCVDLQNDNEHCGACNTFCHTCNGGVCQEYVSCAAIANARPGLPDGRYMIRPKSTKAAGKSAFAVYCHGMTTATPKEYLELAVTGPDKNFAEYGGGGACACADSYRHIWTKLRLDPETLVVTGQEFTFTTSPATVASTACWVAAGGACGSATLLNFANAANCGGSPGKAHVDLTGTPFHISPNNTWSVVGCCGEFGTTMIDGVAVPGNVRKTVDLTGGGGCGGNATSSDLLLVRD